MAQHIGILTSGGDCPGLNAAIRGLGKAAREHYGMRVIGFLNGFRGLAQDQTVELDGAMLSGILTDGGTILGTSRDKPHRMNIGGKETGHDRRDHRHLSPTPSRRAGLHRRRRHAEKRAAAGEAGLNVVTLPKTIDNDISMTDRTFGFDTALQIATEAIDRLHSTATSHERIIVVEVMGHRAGWLALEAGIAGGADVILLPEIPYDVEKIAEAIRRRTQSGKRFSIVVVAEGAMSPTTPRDVATLVKDARQGGLEENPVRGEGETPEIPRRTCGPHHPADEESGETHRPGDAADDSRALAAWRHAIGSGPGVRHLAGDRMRGCARRRGNTASCWACREPA